MRTTESDFTILIFGLDTPWRSSSASTMSGVPTKYNTSSRGSAASASLTPAMLFCGAKSPPITSRAIFMGRGRRVGERE